VAEPAEHWHAGPQGRRADTAAGSTSLTPYSFLPRLKQGNSATAAPRLLVGCWSSP
jgi:hypothetical protein